MTIKKIVLILVGVALAGIILSLFSLNQLGVLKGERNGLFSVNSGIYDLENTQGSTAVKQEVSASLDKTKTLTIIGTSSPIQIEVQKGSEMKAALEGHYKASGTYKPPTLKLKENGDRLTLEIDYPNQGFMFSLQENITLHVSLPESFTGSLEVHSTSGDVTSSYLQLQALKIVTTSADVEVTKTLSIGTIKALSTSGSLTIDGISGGSVLQSTSGNIEGTLVAMSAPVSIESTSGDVEIVQVGNLSYDIDLECTSGEIQVDMPITINQGANSDNRLKGSLEGGGKILNIKTTSGNIDLEKQK